MYKRIALVVGILALALICVLSVNMLSASKSSAELDIVTKAVRNAAVTCYAVEGAFPQDLSYLRSHYGLQYDESRYLVLYDAFSTNLFPDIRVLERAVSAK